MKILNFKKPFLRKDFVNKISENKTILELGPFHNPVCVGDNVKYFDILSQDEMVKRANEIGHDEQAKNVPFIDFVSKTGDLTIIDEKFDAIVSAHVIEHQLDFIGHLNDISKLLDEGSKYFLIIPDKRYCFDHFNNESTIAEIISGAYDKRDKHSIKGVIEHRALNTHNDPSRHWKGDHGDISNNIDRIKYAIAEYEKGDYVDVHAWYFTPNTFKGIVENLKALELIDLEVKELYQTNKGDLEFFAVLKKASSE